jgi:uncharacterized protein HemY
VLHTRYSDHIDEFKKLSVACLIEGLREAVGWHINARDMLEIDVTVLVLLFSVLIVVVDVLRTLMMAVLDRSPAVAIWQCSSRFFSHT